MNSNHSFCGVSNKFNQTVFFIFILLPLLSTCKKDEKSEVLKTISYTSDGRSVKLADAAPIVIDLGSDGSPDFTVFLELFANSAGDHLYAGINPIDLNLIKSGPADDDRFLNMGFLIPETQNTLISNQLQTNQRWTDDFATLVIRNTNTDGAVWHEGSWKDNTPNIVGIQYIKEGKKYFGWLRLNFDKATEVVTLIDYAWEKTPDTPIKAGDH